MSIIDILTSNPALAALAVLIVVLVALAAWKLVREFFPW